MEQDKRFFSTMSKNKKILICLVVFIMVLPAIIEKIPFADIFLERDSKNIEKYSQIVQNNIERILNDPVILRSRVRPFKNYAENYRIVPNHGLAYCNQKMSVLSEIPESLMCFLNYDVIFNGHVPSSATGHDAEILCKEQMDLYDVKDVQAHMNAGYKFLIFVSDPFTRFMDYYMKNCIIQSDGSVGHCFGCSGENNITCVVDQLYSRIRGVADSRSFSSDLHSPELLALAPLTWFCNLAEVYNNTLFIKHADTNRGRFIVAKHFHRLLGSVGVSAIDVQKSYRYTARLLENWKLAKFSEGKDLIIDSVKKNETLFNTLYEIYEVDFEVFEFTPPVISSNRLFYS